MSFESKIETLLNVTETTNQVRNEDIKQEEVKEVTKEVNSLVEEVKEVTSLVEEVVCVENQDLNKEVIPLNENTKEEAYESRITEEDMRDFNEYVELCTKKEREEYEKHSISMSCMRKIAKDMFLDEFNCAMLNILLQIKSLKEEGQ